MSNGYQRRPTVFRRLAFATLFLAGTLAAQTTVSTLRGTATDQTGSVVVGAKVTIVNLRTNVERVVTTSEHGDYEVLDLQKGTYRLTAGSPGFKTFVADNIILESNQIRRVDLSFEVGAVTAELTVSASAAVIQTDTGTITTQFEDKQFQDAPLLGILPSPTIMMGTLAGVQPSGYYATISGQPRAQISDAMDGVPRDRLNGMSPSINANEELKVVAVNNTADQSRVASFNAVSKSGGNQLHGRLFYKHVNGALIARESFQTSKPRFLSHEWDAEILGPIRKNKTFFYGNFLQQRIPASSYRRASVPTARMRQGDFSEFSKTLTDPTTGRAFPQNLIPRDRMNAVSLKANEKYPQPNLGAALTDNYGWTFPYPSDYYKGDFPLVRVDHSLTQANSMFFKYSYYYCPYVLPSGGLPGFNRTKERYQDRGVVSDTHIFTPAVVNTFRFGFTGNDITNGETVDGYTPPTGDESVRELGLQGVNPRGLRASGYPRMQITGLAPLENVPGGVEDDNYDYYFDNSLSWVKGRHVWKFGVQVYDYNDFDGLLPTGTYGDFNFDGYFTGIGYGDFLLGLPHTSTRLDPLVNRWKLAKEVGLYAMDTFKVSHKLTLDYGLRWDYYGSPTYQDGLQYNWDPGTGKVVVPESAVASIRPLYPRDRIGVVTGRAVATAQKTNFRPRTGFAYRLRGDAVIRGGYGIFTERVSLSYFDRLFGGGPFEMSETYYNRVDNGRPLFAFPNPFPASLAAATVPSQSIGGYPLDTNHGSVHQFNLSFEKQIGAQGLRVSYIGSRNRGMNYNLNINKPAASLTAFAASRLPYPQFVSTTFWQSNGRGRFDSLQFEVQRKMGNLRLDAHYTLANNMADYLNLENPYDHQFWNRVDYTSRHRAVVNVMYDLPLGRGKAFLNHVPAALDQVIGGWELYAISFFGTGSFFSPRFTGSDPSNTNTFGGLPDRVGQGTLPRGERTVARWFDAKAFAVPPKGRFGNSGVNVLQGPGYNVHHLSLTKRFSLSERFRLSYTARATNLFNHAHFQNPYNNISAPGAGSLYVNVPEYAPEQNGARRIQMELRLTW